MLIVHRGLPTKLTNYKQYGRGSPALSLKLEASSKAWRCTVSRSAVKLLSCLIVMQELRRPCKCFVT